LFREKPFPVACSHRWTCLLRQKTFSHQMSRCNVSVSDRDAYEFFMHLLLTIYVLSCPMILEVVPVFPSAARSVWRCSIATTPSSIFSGPPLRRDIDDC